MLRVIRVDLDNLMRHRSSLGVVDWRRHVVAGRTRSSCGVIAAGRIVCGLVNWQRSVQYVACRGRTDASPEGGPCLAGTRICAFFLPSSNLSTGIIPNKVRPITTTR